MHLLRAKEKKERALQTKLFLKAHRCSSPKCATVRRPQRPGVHGARFSRGGSEFKTQLMEKQKIKISYGLSEKQLKGIFQTALAKKGAIEDAIISALEMRLDNTVFKLGLAPSRIVARQVVSHGHIAVNGRKTNIPSYRVRVGDIIAIPENKKNYLLFKELPTTLKGRPVDPWLLLDAQKLEGVVKSAPEHVQLPFNINLVVDYYAR
ncbi:MAG: 30S ribosomal protein S4 [Candidatus Paceibacterota bacterium]|jgi:small subunit ribosomal protein S4